MRNLQTFLTTHRAVIALILLAIIVRVGYMALLMQTRGLDGINNGDYDLYVFGAQHFLDRGDFNNSLFLVRPPFFPLLIALLGLNATLILLLNALIGGLTTGFVYLIGSALRMPPWVVLAACLWFALDPKTIDKGAVLLDPIPWSVFGITGMITLLLRLWRAETSRQALGSAVGAAVFFAVAVLARPESFLLWTGIGVFMLIIARRWWLPVLVTISLCALVVGGWIMHNDQVFGYRTYSTISVYTMLYYRANSVQRLATGQDIDTINRELTERVEVQLGNDPALVTADTPWSYFAGTPQIGSALVHVSLDVFLTYPLEYAVTFVVGLLRMYSTLPESNSISDWVMAIYNAVLMTLALIGWGRLVYTRQWVAAILIFLMVGYYTAGVLLVKNAALEGRERAVLNPYIMLCASMAVYWLMQRVPALQGWGPARSIR